MLIDNIFNEKNVTKCGVSGSGEDLVCCNNEWIEFIEETGFQEPDYRNVFVSYDIKNFCGVFGDGSCMRRQLCRESGKKKNNNNNFFDSYELQNIIVYMSYRNCKN